MLLILDNYDSFTYNLFQAFAPRAGEVRVVRNDAATVAEIEAMNPKAIVISPGPCTPNEAGISVDLIRRLAPKVPILGVCLGHQSIGAAFGGTIVRAPEVRHGRTSPVFHRRKDLFRDLPLPFVAGRYHSLVIDRASMPAELSVEADTADETVMAVRHLEYPCFGIQFHPESILTPEGPRLIGNFLKIAGLDRLH